MNYESINEQYSNGNTFFKLKYGFENKTKELEKFMWENKKAKIKKIKPTKQAKSPIF